MHCMINVLTKKIKRFMLIAACIVVAICVTAWAFVSLRTASNDRIWEPEQQKISHATINGNTVTIHDLRYFKYPAGEPTRVQYEDRTIDLTDVEGVDFVVSYFSESNNIAHTFLTFRIKDQPGISISIEARRELNEEYSPLMGLFGKYELMYVIGDERDIIGLRTHVRNERLYLYPTIATTATSQKIFIAMIQRLNELYTEPALYNTVFDNCTNLLARHIESVSDRKIPLSYKMLLPGHADTLAYDLGLLQTELPFTSLKIESRIYPKDIVISDPMFSQKIRNTTIKGVDLSGDNKEAPLHRITQSE